MLKMLPETTGMLLGMLPDEWLEGTAAYTQEMLYALLSEMEGEGLVQRWGVNAADASESDITGIECEPTDEAIRRLKNT